MTRFLALLPDPVMQARLRDALKTGRTSHGVHQMFFANSWEDAFRVALHSSPDIMIFDPYASGKLDVHSCASWAAGFPAAALFAYGDFDRSAAPDVLRLARAGVRGVATREVDDTPAVLLSLLNELLSDKIAGAVTTALGSHLTPELAALVRYLVESARLPIMPKMAARFYHRDAKTLREHLRKAGLPPISRLIVWIRLLYAAHLLQDPARSVESVALTLGFPSDNAFRNQLQRYMGVCPKELRARGGFEFALNEFRRQCKEAVRCDRQHQGKIVLQRVISPQNVWVTDVKTM
jgi:AraC-like DNA-binding protein